MPSPTDPKDPDYVYPDWSIVPNAHHNVRAICDLEGLNWEQKQILAACVYQESQFKIGAHHENYAFHKDGTRYLSSTDYGIVQINDYWHIEGFGPGHDFPSVEYVYGHPEECVRWMAKYYKQHGHLNAWCSYTTGAYKPWLNKV